VTGPPGPTGPGGATGPTGPAGPAFSWASSGGIDMFTGGYRGSFQTSASNVGIVLRTVDGVLVQNSASSVSKRKFKEQIEDMEPALPILESLRPRNFKWNDLLVNKDYQEDIHDMQVQKQYGFIVEEVEEANPDLVHYSFDNDIQDPQMWKSNAFISLAIKAIQELSAEITSLKERIAILEG